MTFVFHNISSHQWHYDTSFSDELWTDADRVSVCLTESGTTAGQSGLVLVLYNFNTLTKQTGSILFSRNQNLRNIF